MPEVPTTPAEFKKLRITSVYLSGLMSNSLVLFIVEKGKGYVLKLIFDGIYDSKTLQHFEIEEKITKLINKNVLDKGLTPHILPLLDSRAIPIPILKLWPADCSAVWRKFLSFKGEINKQEFRPADNSQCIIDRSIMEDYLSSRYGGLLFPQLSTSFGLLLQRWWMKDFRMDPSERTAKLLAAQFKILLFELVFTLAQIQSVYPNFRHNDLHIDNLFIEDFGPKGVGEPEYYHFGGNYYKMPAFAQYKGYLADFGWSSIDGLVANDYAKISELRVSQDITMKKNLRYDFMFFVKSFIVSIENMIHLVNPFKTELINIILIDLGIKRKTIGYMLKYPFKYQDRMQLSPSDFPTPAELLKSRFKGYRIPKNKIPKNYKIWGL